MKKFKQRVLRAFVAIVMVALVFGASAAQADSYFFSIGVTGSGTCNNNSFNIFIFEGWNLPAGGNLQHYTEQLNGVILKSDVSPFFSGAGSLGPVPTQPDVRYNIAQPYAWVYTGDILANGTVVSHVTLTVLCNNNIAVATAANGQVAPTPVPVVIYPTYPTPVYTYPVYPIYPTPIYVYPVYPTPIYVTPVYITPQPTPVVSSSGFVLHTITCDVPLYDRPGGNAIGGTLIKNGQTWFVAPGVSIAPNGSAWSVINVGMVTTAYIPTSCVN